MGGGGQANSGQASTAAAQQTAANNQDMALSAQNAAVQKRMVNTLFGNGSLGSSGTLTGMMNPASLTQTNFNPAYQAQWNADKNNVNQNYAQQRGSLAQQWANSGLGTNNTPSGFQANQMRTLGNSQADTLGATYAGLKGQQYSDALNNFWNANNIASGNAATAGSTATGAAGNAGSSSAQIYGTAGQYHAPAFASAVGSGLQAGGSVGAAAMCPAEGSRILMSDGSWKPIENLQKGDYVLGADNRPDELIAETQASVQEVCEVHSIKSKVKVSLTHAFIRSQGGYAIAAKCLGDLIETDDSPNTCVVEVKLSGERMICFHLFLKRSHSYNVEGFWSLE